jgi:AcrR family transcriptional regulator
MPIMATSDFQRARSVEQKQQRRDEMLAAARNLALARGVRAVTMSDIADDIGLHKSAVLRYFETREAVFLELATEGWVDWMDACAPAIRSAAGDPSRVARAIADTLAQRPLFCDLLGHAPMNLERGVSAEAVRQFKVIVLEQVDRFLQAATAALPSLTEADGRALVTAVCALTSSLWQVSHPPEPVAAMYRSNPELGHATVDFAPDLYNQAETVILGLLSRRH